jgi:hypothetical protein
MMSSSILHRTLVPKTRFSMSRALFVQQKVPFSGLYWHICEYSLVNLGPPFFLDELENQLGMVFPCASFFRSFIIIQMKDSLKE